MLWKSPLFAPFYEVSNNGHIRRILDKHGRRKSLPRLLKPRLNKGYATVTLSMPGYRPKKYFVHSLVLMTFGQLRPDGLECRHLNGQKSDNRLENLCWGTHKENYQDQMGHGTCKLQRGGLGRLCLSRRKFNEKQCKNICEEYVPRKVSMPMLAKKYKTSMTTIQSIIFGTYPRKPYSKISENSYA